MYHEFSVIETVKTSWRVLKKNFVPLIVYSVISLFISGFVDFLNAFIFVSDDRVTPFIIIFIQMVIQSFLVLSFYKLILILMDKEYYEFEFKEIVPSIRMTFNFILIAIAYGVLICLLLFINLLIENYIARFDTVLLLFRIVELGLIIYLLIRSIFCVCFIVDDDSSPLESLKQSFGITKDSFLKTILMFFIIIFFMVAMLIPIWLLVQISGVDESKNEFAQQLMYYGWFILAFPAVQVLIMVTYRKLVYSHLDVDDDISETI
jgi:hypothetical protein